MGGFGRERGAGEGDLDSGSERGTKYFVEISGSGRSSNWSSFALLVPSVHHSLARSSRPLVPHPPALVCPDEKDLPRIDVGAFVNCTTRIALYALLRPPDSPTRVSRRAATLGSSALSHFDRFRSFRAFRSQAPVLSSPAPPQTTAGHPRVVSDRVGQPPTAQGALRALSENSPAIY